MFKGFIVRTIKMIKYLIHDGDLDETEIVLLTRTKAGLYYLLDRWDYSQKETRRLRE